MLTALGLDTSQSEQVFVGIAISAVALLKALGLVIAESMFVEPLNDGCPPCSEGGANMRGGVDDAAQTPRG